MSESTTFQNFPKSMQAFLNIFVEVQRALPAQTESRLLVFFGNPAQPVTGSPPHLGIFFFGVIIFTLYYFEIVGFTEGSIYALIGGYFFDIAVGVIWSAGKPYFRLTMPTEPLQHQYEVSLNRQLKSLLVTDHIYSMSSQTYAFSALREIEIRGFPDEAFSAITITVTLRITDFEISLDNKPQMAIGGQKKKIDFNLLFLRNVLSLSEWCCCPIRFLIEDHTHIVFDPSLIQDKRN